MDDVPDDRDDGRPVLVDRYRLGRVLGRGGAADVHVATDVRLSRQVAVKLLRETAEDPSSRTRFVQEAQVLAQLSHPGIVTVLDAGFTGNQPFLVMEMIEGLTLGQVLHRGVLGAAEVGDIGAQVAAAMAHAHAAGVVHRDVKPSNVIIGPGGRVKVVDFGIARLIGDTVRHTRTGMAVGTAAYLAPEQVMGQHVSGPADVYALGLTLLEALTGERAFPGPSTEAALARLHRSPEVPQSIPAPWVTLLTAMTATDQAARPTAEQVAAELGTRRAHAPDGPGGDHGPGPDGPTRLLTAVEPLAAHPPQAPPHAGAGRGAGRGTGAGADLLRRGRTAWSRLSPSTQGAVAAIAALVLLLVVVAFASRSTPSPDIPDETPAELRDPLTSLHDAVEGE